MPHEKEGQIDLRLAGIWIGLLVAIASPFIAMGIREQRLITVESVAHANDTKINEHEEAQTMRDLKIESRLSSIETTVSRNTVLLEKLVDAVAKIR